MTGRDSKLYIKYSGYWIQLKCEMSSDISESSSMVNSYSEGWQSGKANLQSYSIDVSGLFVSRGDKVSIRPASDVLMSYQLLTRLKRTREIIDWQRRTDNIIETGQACITNINNVLNASEFATFDLTLAGFGKPSLVDRNNLEGVLGSAECDILINDEDESIKV